MLYCPDTGEVATHNFLKYHVDYIEHPEENRVRAGDGTNAVPNIIKSIMPCMARGEEAHAETSSHLRGTTP